MTSYRLRPSTSIPGQQALRGWPEISAALKSERLIIDTYPGVDLDEVIAAFARSGTPVIRTTDLLLPQEDLDRLLAPWVGGSDPVFALRCPLELSAWFDPDRLADARTRSVHGPVLIVGPGATLVSQSGSIVLADLPR